MRKIFSIILLGLSCAGCGDSSLINLVLGDMSTEKTSIEETNTDSKNDNSSKGEE
jgi:hypothetical protein